LGEEITLTWTVNNIGTGSALANWYDYIYLSADEILDANDTYLDWQSAPGSSPLNASSSYTSQKNLSVSGIAPGQWYLLVKADGTGYQAESNENNNVSAVPITLGSIDLVPNITSNLNTTTSGTTLSLEWTVNNTGTAAATKNWVDRIYLSTDNKFDANDLLLNEYNRTQPLLANSSYSTQLDIDLPLEVSGNRYLLVVTNADNQVIETNGTNNNVASKLIQINLAPYADLAVSNVIFTPGGTIIGDPASATISWTVTNIGTGAGITSKWYDRIIASVDGIVGNSDDVILGEFEHSGIILKDAYYNQSKTIQLNDGFEGKYKLFVQTNAPVRDSNGKIIYSVFENGLEANNTASSPNDFLVARKPYADLTVTKVDTEGTTTLTGRFFKLNWEVANNGIAVTDSVSWNDTVQLARKNSDGALELIGSPYYFDCTGVLSNQKEKNTYTRSRDVFIPYDLVQVTIKKVRKLSCDRKVYLGRKIGIWNFALCDSFQG
jgi:hypothetical protein